MGRVSSKSISSFFSYADWAVLNIIHLEILLYLQNKVTDFKFDYTIHIIFSNLFWLICANVAGVYYKDRGLDMKKKVMRLTAGYLLTIFAGVAMWRSNHYQALPDFLIIDFTSFGLYLFTSRLIVYSCILTLNNNKVFRQKIVVIGCNDFSEQFIDQFEKSNITHVVQGYFDDRGPGARKSDYPILGKIKDCLPYAIANGITEIYSTIAPERNSDIYHIAELAEKNFIRFRFVPDMRQYINRDHHLNFIDDQPVVTLRSEPLANLSGQIIKRLFDVVLSSFVIVFILSWLIPILAIIIKLDSKGPVFFRQVRTGERNKPFMCLKFRSLKVNNDADTRQVTRNDDRYTRVGKFLRKTNLDELPQFFNVLMGQMSVVGSRPHMLKHTEDYSRIYKNYMLRHFVKPGLTGWAQINGYRGEIQVDEQLIKRVEHDIWYMENWSFWLDLRIVFMTFFTMIKGDKNAF